MREIANSYIFQVMFYIPGVMKYKFIIHRDFYLISPKVHCFYEEVQMHLCYKGPRFLCLWRKCKLVLRSCVNVMILYQWLIWHSPPAPPFEAYPSPAPLCPYTKGYVPCSPLPYTLMLGCFFIQEKQQIH